MPDTERDVDQERERARADLVEYWGAMRRYHASEGGTEETRRLEDVENALVERLLRASAAQPEQRGSVSAEWLESVARGFWEADAREHDMTADDRQHAKLIGLSGAYYEAADVAADYLLWSSAGTVEGEPLTVPWAVEYWKARAAQQRESDDQAFEKWEPKTESDLFPNRTAQPEHELDTDSEHWPTWRCVACDRLQAIPEGAHIEPSPWVPTLRCIDCDTAFRLSFHGDTDGE